MTDDLNKYRSLKPDHASPGRNENDERAKHSEEDASSKKKLDKALDRALEESFPGSDPVSITQPAASVYDKHENQKR